jgi:hypothetical protein
VVRGAAAQAVTASGVDQCRRGGIVDRLRPAVERTPPRPAAGGGNWCGVRRRCERRTDPARLQPAWGRALEGPARRAVLWVELHQLIPVAVLYGAVLLAFAMFDLRRQRLMFYLLFAVTITASVQLIGVFLAFASLILPALSASASSPRWRLSFGYGVGLAGYKAGLVISGLWDVPTGAAIVCALAFVAAVAAMLSPFSESEVTS